MKLQRRLGLIVSVLLLLAGAVLALSACGGSDYEIDYEIWYYSTTESGQQVRYSIACTLTTDKDEGNVLDSRGYTIAPPFGYTFGGYRLRDGTKIFDSELRQVEGVELDRNIREIYPIWIPKIYTFLFVEKEVDGRLYVNDDYTFTLQYEDYFSKETVNHYQIPSTDPSKACVGWYANPNYPGYLAIDYNGDRSFQGLFAADRPDTYFKHESSYIDENGTRHDGLFVFLRPVFDYQKQQITIDYRTSGVTNLTLQANDGQPLPDLSEHKRPMNAPSGKVVYGFSTSPDEYIPHTGNVSGPLTLYAIWEGYETVNLHYGEHSSQLTVYEISPNILTVPDSVLEQMSNYTFGGWYDNEGCTGTPYTTLTYGLTQTDYYAKWIPLTYSLTFNTKGGEEMADGSYVYGEGNRLPIPEKANSKFLGWCLDEGLQTTPFFEMPSDASGSYTLYAKWEESRAISTKEELLAIAANPAGGYYLTNDINLEGEAWTPIPAFSGTLEGNGYAIKNFSLQTSSAADGYAFIVENRGQIKNLTLKDFSVGYYNVKYAGILVAKNYGDIQSCHILSRAEDTTACAIEYSISHNSGRDHLPALNYFIGGIASYNDALGSISGCTVSTPIKITHYAQNTADGIERYATDIFHCGSICGQNKGVIRNSSAAREIDITGSAFCDNGRYNTLLKGELQITEYFRFGGIVGSNEEGATVLGCHASVKLAGSVTANTSKNDYVFLRATFGGVVGLNHGDVTTSYSENAEIRGNFTQQVLDKVGLGGLVGQNGGTGKIANCYTENFKSLARNITTGGLVGNNLGLVQTSYVLDAVLSVEGTANNWFIGGFVGYNHTTASVRNCLVRATLDLVAHTALSQQFAGDNVGVLMSCHYSDGSRLLVTSQEQALIPDANTPAKEDASLFSQDFLTEDLYWSETVWQIDGENPPTLIGNP